MMIDSNGVRNLSLYVLLAITGSLLSAWGWWVTTSIIEASAKRAAMDAEWGLWRGQTTERLAVLQTEMVNVRRELEEIKLYLRARGSKSKERPTQRPDMVPEAAELYPAGTG